MRQIYLDYNATTPVAPSVFEAMKPFLTEHFGNPSSQHVLGIAANQAVEDARERVARLLGARSDEIFFTSGGTESNNLAILGRFWSDGQFSGHLVTSVIEHPAVSAPADRLRQAGCEVSAIPVDSQGRVDPAEVKANLRPDTRLISIMHANNEIGTVQNLADISQLCRSHQIAIHTDAAQSVGKIRTRVDELGVDLLSIAGHKLYAPKGVGALYVKRGTSLSPLMSGASHEKGLRPGTENVASIVALGQAARLAERSVQEYEERLAGLRDRLFQNLRSVIGPRLTLNAEHAARLPNTLSVNFPDVSGADLLDRAPEICASTGSACHSGTTQLSATLRGIGLPPDQARGTVRLSLGWNTSSDEIERASNALLSAWESLTGHV